jgi:hypothetical protein
MVAEETSEMSTLLKIGIPVFVVSVVGASVNLWARSAFPDHWGGPNIGGGFLQLLFYIGGIAGVALIIAGFVTRSKDKTAP